MNYLHNQCLCTKQGKRQINIPKFTKDIQNKEVKL